MSFGKKRKKKFSFLRFLGFKKQRGELIDNLLLIMPSSKKDILNVDNSKKDPPINKEWESTKSNTSNSEN